MAADVTQEPLLEMRGIVKQFPGVRALDGVDLDVRAGEVHCLLGQNGAGKSTLIKVLSGAHQPDEGTVRWRGEPVGVSSPHDALRLGIATIYQELDLVPGLSVADNVHLGRELASGGFVRRGDQIDATRAILKRLGHGEISPSREVGRLSAAGQQIVSLARALAQDARVIVMDEPSAVLAHDEVDNLFRVIRDLTASGVAVVYISHRLEEIRTIGDVVTVLKDGRTVGTGLPAKETPTQRVVALMTGRNVEYVFPERPAPTSPAMPTISPARTVSETSRNAPSSDRPSTRSSSSASSGTPRRGGNTYSTFRPVINETTSWVGVSFAGRSVPTVRPSLSTVTTSPMVRISSSRWEM